MNAGRILAIVYGMLGIVVALTMGLNIQTANAAIQAANLTNLTGMAVMDDWGAALIILGILTMSGVFIYGGVTGTYGAGIKDIMFPIFAAISAVVSLTLMTSIITGANNLIGATTTDAEDVIWGVIPLVVYIAIIAAASAKTFATVKKIRKSKKSKAAVSEGY